MIQQFSGKQPAQHLSGAKGVPLPRKLPPAVIDGGVEQQRCKLKGHEGCGRRSNPNRAAYTGTLRSLRTRDQCRQAKTQGADIPIDEVCQQGQTKRGPCQRQVLSAANGPESKAE